MFAHKKDKDKNKDRDKDDLRVIFIFKNFGLIKGISHIGLGVSAFNTSETLKQNGILAEVWSILNVEDMLVMLEKEYVNSKNGKAKPITHIVISAPWVPTDQIAKMICKYPDIDFITLSHSNVAFLGADLGGIRRLREGIVLQREVNNYFIAGNCEKFVRWASVAWDADVAFLPNLYNIKDMTLREHKHWKDKYVLKIGCFGAIRPLKNQITAAAAALDISKRLKMPTELWFNSGRNEGGNGLGSIQTIEQLVGNIPGFMIKYKLWSPWDKFREFVGTMDLTLQPSFTESYNMVVSDSIYESVPAVVSSAINWVPDNWIGNSDDADEMANIGIKLLNDQGAARDGQEALKKYVKNGLKAWKKFLQK
jgi:glycosyltransferase involved in cell wall biosynthesis